MNFIQPTEHVIAMDYNAMPGRRFNDDELAQLRDAGVQTVACYLRWDWTETASGVYDWTAIDSEVEAIRAAGLKALVKCYLWPPSFFPDNWYLWAQDGTIKRTLGQFDAVGDVAEQPCISPWHPEAAERHWGFIARACGHLDLPGVQCVNISPANGAALLPGANLFYDPAAQRSWQRFAWRKSGESRLREEMGDAKPDSMALDWLRSTLIPFQIETQRIFVRHCGEYWTMLHHAFETIPSTGNWLIDDLYAALRREFPEAEHWGICYTVFRPGETRGIGGVERDIKQHGIKMLVAAEGPIGLLTNTKRAITMGARGMLVGPLAPYLGFDRMQPWMFEAIRTSLRQWEQV